VNSKPINKSHQQIAWLILVLLLCLRIPFTITIIYFLPIENQIGGAIYETSTYFLIAALIWWERDQLLDFHIDTSALLIIITLRPFQTLILNYWKVDSPLAFPKPFGLTLWGISIGLSLLLWQSGFKLTRISFQSLGWLALGIAAGICVSIGENAKTFASMISDTHISSTPLLPVFYSTSLNLVYHLGFAPINEEPLFRGFLWGYLRQSKWHESSIWIFQAVIFTFAHVYFARQFPLMFWVYIPGAALIFGLLAWRSRSIAPALLAHGLINGSVYLLVVITFRILS